MDILRNICLILQAREPVGTGKERKLEVLSNMLHKLIQHLILGEPWSVTIRGYYSFEMQLNQDFIISGNSLKAVYLCSVLVILLRLNVSAANAIAPPPSSPYFYIRSATTAQNAFWAQATVDLLNAYKHKTTVRKLQTLCIRVTRQSMYRLDDESFQSLPVPPYLQKMLKLQDIADALFEGYKMWPKCMSVQRTYVTLQLFCLKDIKHGQNA